MTEKEKMHERLAHLHLNRIEPNKGKNPKIAAENEKHLHIAQHHIRMAGGEL
jgi:hypothetical protein